MHGTAAADLVGWSITGSRNTFINTHFAGPMVAGQDATGYIGVSITGSENYFKSCTFGTNTIARAGAFPNVSLGAGSSNFSYNIFEDCTFLLTASATSPMFVNVLNSVTPCEIYAEFRGCRFICTSANMATSIAAAFTFAGAYTSAMILDQNCQFYGTTAIGAAGAYPYIQIPATANGASTTLTTALLAAKE
jgi:hypothetical protein